MKYGRSINELALELNRQQLTKVDFVKPLQDLEFIYEDELGRLPELLVAVEAKNHDGLITSFQGGINRSAHLHFGKEFSIPMQYYDRMLTAPELLAFNLQYWIKSNKRDTRMLRTLDGRLRAVLSDKYRILDNFELFNMIMPTLLQAGCTIESCEVTETRLYIKAVTHKIQGEVKKGEPISMGVIVQNSEVGQGALSIKPFLMFLVCTNGAVVDKLASRKYHVQRSRGDDFAEGFTFSPEVLNLENGVFWKKTKEVVEQTLTEATLNRALELITEAPKIELVDPVKAVEVVAKDYKFNLDEKDTVMNYLIRGGDITKWGLGNAVTRTAQDLDSYDRATEFERFGFQILSN